jgi:hypothetical protein
MDLARLQNSHYGPSPLSDKLMLSETTHPGAGLQAGKEHPNQPAVPWWSDRDHRGCTETNESYHLRSERASAALAACMTRGS